jgi:hypothetical protein
MIRKLLMALLALGLLAGLGVLAAGTAGATQHYLYSSTMSCSQWLNRYSPATAQQAERMKTPPAAFWGGKTCRDSLHGRSVNIPLTRGGAVLYSDPTFCSKELPGTQCLNGRGAKDTIGTHVQVWRRERTFAAEDGNYFVMYRYTWVRYGTSNVTPLQWSAYKTWRQEYNGWAVVNVEKVACTSRECFNSGNCISTIGSHTLQAGNGVRYYFPITLDRCSTSSATDTRHTMAVWNRNSPNGYRIQPVTLSRNVKVLQHYSCRFTYPQQTDCEPGDGVIMSSLRTPHWEHWNFP